MLRALRYTISFLAFLLLLLCGALAGVSCSANQSKQSTEPLTFSLIPFGSVPAPPRWSSVHMDGFAANNGVPRFRGVPLSQALDTMAALARMPIDVNWPALAAEGIRGDEPVSDDFSGLPWHVALARMLQRQRLAFTVDANTIEVSTPREIGRADRVRRAAPRLPTSIEPPNEAAPARLPRDVYLMRWTRLGEVLDCVARWNRLDVDWNSLTHAGVGPATRIDIEGYPPDLLGAALRQASLDHDLQYEARNGRLLLSTREWFDQDEQPRMRLLLACAGGVALVGLASFVLLRRRPMLRRITLLSLGVLTSAGAFVLTRSTHASQFDATFAGMRWIAAASPAGSRGTYFWFRREPHDWQAAALRPRAQVMAWTKIVRPLHLSLQRSARPFVQFDASVPCRTLLCLLAIGPVVWAILLMTWQTRGLLRQRARRTRGQCLACGYDLRGSGDRCPECGMTSPEGEILR